MDEEFIFQEIHKQHLQCADNAKDLVLALVSQSHNAVSAGIALQDMGLAYKNAGCYYIANPIHLKLALQGFDDFSEWQKLETYTIAFTRFCQHTAYSNSENIVLPKAEACLKQDRVGEVPSNMLSGEASILKLVDSHPVIDSILYCPKHIFSPNFKK